MFAESLIFVSNVSSSFPPLVDAHYFLTCVKSKAAKKSTPIVLRWQKTALAHVHICLCVCLHVQTCKKNMYHMRVTRACIHSIYNGFEMIASSFDNESLLIRSKEQNDSAMPWNTSFSSPSQPPLASPLLRSLAPMS